MAVNVKLGVDLGSFNSNINQAKAQIKSFDAALKFAESSFKATGDAEAAMTTKTQALTGKLSAQKNMVQQYSQALKQMQSQGVDPMSASYQKLQTQMLTAQAAMMDTQAALNGLDGSQQQAANSADALTKSVNGISKKISLDQVISGINKITDGLEGAARKAVDLGKAIWNEVIEQASKADDIATKAMMYDLTPERYQAMQKMANTWSETSVDMIMKARQRVQGRIGDMTDTLMGIGVDPYVNKKRVLGTKDQYTGQLKDWEDIFWETGEALMNLDDKYKQANAAQEIFGQKWESLKPMFEMGRDAYEAALEAETVNSAEAIEKMAKLNDTVNDLKSDFETLEREVLAGLAPALTKAAEVLDKLLADLMEYLEKPEGQQMLERMEQAVAGIFEDLANIDPEDVVNNFVNVFNTLVGSFEWIKDNWSTVVSGIESIGVAFGLLKVSEGVLTFMKLASGVKGFFGSGTGGGVGLGAASGLSAKLLATGGGVALTGAAATIGGALMPYAGPLAAVPMVIEDQTMFFRTLRNGGSLEEAAAESGKAVEQAFNGAKKAWEDWGNDIINVPKKLAESVWKDLFGGGNNEPTAEVKVEPKTDKEAAAMISAQIGTVSVPVRLVIQGGNSSKGPNGALGIGGGGGGMMDYYYEQVFGGFTTGFANGIPWVPDTMLAWLHPGERVMTASQNRSYTANSNLYVERMIMNNGQDAEGLAAAMAAQNRRVSAGFGA